MIDYFALFIVLTMTLVVSNVITLLIASKVFAKEAGFNYARGRMEYRDEQEKQYTRKRV